MKTIIIYTTLALAILIISMDHAFAIDSDSTKAKKGFFELGKSKGLMMASSLGMHINPTNNSYHIIDPFYYQSPKSTVAVNMQHTIGYQFDERFIVGFGFGFENFDYLMVPTFLDLRFNLSKSDHTFFLVTKSGYSHPWDKEDEYRQYYGGYYHFSG
ncbi:MAG: hypothetical protein MRY83_25185, partial [Flavobacteriales bacterium]|nr:hypothetical protein [Flavobacteriales bacterium]